MQVRQYDTGRVSRSVGRFHAVAAIAFSGYSDELLVASRDGQADVWTVFGVTRKFELRADVELTAAAWAWGRRVVATAGKDGRVRVWDALSRLDVVPALAHESAVTRLAFSPEGRWLATATEKGLIRTWDLAAAEQAGELEPVVPRVSVGDGWEAELGSDRAVRVRWRGEVVSAPLRVPEATGAEVREGRVRVGTGDGTGRRWWLGAEQESLESLRRRAEVLSARRVVAGGRLEPLDVDGLLDRWRGL